MLSNFEAAHQAIKNAVDALEKGDKHSARRWAERAVSQDRDIEEGWLILAEVSTPRARIAYIEQALKLNPHSLVALEALSQAKADYQKYSERPAAKTQPVKTKKAAAGLPAKKTRLLFSSKLLPVLAAALFVVACLLVGGIWTGWNGDAFGIRSIVMGDDPSEPVSISSNLGQLFGFATETPTPTRTFTPTPVPSFTPTATFTASPTATYTPTITNTPRPTNTPTPQPTATFTPTPEPTEEPAAPPEPEPEVYTVKRGDTLVKIASRYGVDLSELIRVNGISSPANIKAGLKLTIPNGSNTSSQVREVAAPVPSNRSAKKTIVVSISDQHVYAYEGDNEVMSFPASTGKNGGTLAGTFKVLDKIPNAYSDPWGFWMPYWMGIYYVGYNLENGFHSLPVLSNGKQLWEDQIGVNPVTYGCVVLLPDDMKKLFSWADIGTAIEIRK